MVFDWSDTKNDLLKREQGIGFERIVVAIEQGCILDVLEHPRKTKYRNQYVVLVEIDTYVYVIPSVREKGYWFLKTMFPSRKYTDIYLPNARRKK